jgi:hypothetical protein
VTLSIAGDFDAPRIFGDNPVYSSSDFIINCNSTVLQEYALYLLPMGRIYTSGYGGVGGIQRNMNGKDSFKSGDIYITEALLEDMHETTLARRLFENDVYYIYGLDDDSLLLWDYRGMSYTQEIKLVRDEYAVLRKVTSNRVEFEIMALRVQSADISINFYDERQRSGPKSAEVFVNGESKSVSPERNNVYAIALGGIFLNRGVNNITIEFEGDISMTSLESFQFLK